MTTKKISKDLRYWFVIHFWVDVLFAIPLMLIPIQTLQWLGFETAETLTARLVGAALLGIGGTSLLMHNAGKTAFRTMLQLKLIWSEAAIVAILLTLWNNRNLILWVLLGIFVLFSGVWNYYYFFKKD